MKIGLGIGVTQPQNMPMASVGSPSYLFRDGAQGTWYDPSDINLTWRRNLLTYSEQFDNAAWTKFDLSVTANAVVAPDGTQTADKLVASAVNSTHAIRQIPGLASNSSVNTFSFFAKAGEYQGVIYQNTNGLMVAFNCLTGARTGGDNVAYSITDSGNGWWRIAITHKLVGLDGQNLLYVSNLTNPGYASAYTGDGTSGIYIWGAQLELGSTATPYQRITDGVQDYLSYQAQPVLYRDAAGTTPVTSVEQPVGLMLDKSKGLVLGPNVCTTTFPITASANGTLVARMGSVVTGTWYKLTYTITASTLGNGGVLYFEPAGGPFAYQVLPSAVGTYTVYVYAADAELSQAGILLGGGPGITGSVTLSGCAIQAIPGNHAFNPSGNSANFSVLSARYNLLTKTEDFSDAAWVKSALTATSSSVTATGAFASARQTVAVSPSAQYTQVAEVQFGSGATQIFSLLSELSDTSYTASFDLQSGTVVVQSNCTATITALGGGYYRISATFTNAAGVTSLTPKYWIGIYNGANNSGTVFNIRNADFRATNDALNQPAYQRVNTSTDYDTVGFKPYLKFNGANQWLQTNSIDFTYGDKMFVVAGVRKLSDAATGMFLEFSGAYNLNNGTFADYSDVGTLTSTSKGTTATFAYSSVAAPATKVHSSVKNISASSNVLRLNGTQVAQDTTSQGTGNYGNYPLYIGARGGSGLWFNGRLYGMVVAGKQASAVEIDKTEDYIALKTGFTYPRISGVPTFMVVL